MGIFHHFWQMAGLTLILAGPLPLIGSILLEDRVRREQEDPRKTEDHDGGGPKKALSSARSFARKWLVILAMWCVAQVAVESAAGWLHLLRPSVILLAEIVLFAGGSLLLAATVSRTKIPITSLVPSPSSRLSPSEFVVVGALAAFSLFAVWYCASTPTTNYDSWAYHLPVIAHWFQTGQLSMIDPGDPIYRFPMSWELLCTLTTLPFGEDFLVTLPNLVAWLILGFSVFLLSSRLGATRLSALAAVSLLLLSPQIARMLNSNQVDLAFSAFVLAAMVFTIESLDTRSGVSAGLALTSWSMALGIKLTGAIYLVSFFIVLAIGEVGLRNWKTLASRIPRSRYKLLGNALSRRWFLLTVTAALLTSAPWYLRNLLQVGNPLGSIQLKLFGSTIFPGALTPSYLKSTSLFQVFNFHDVHDYLLYGKILRREMGALFLIAAVAASLLMPWLLRHSRRRRALTTLALTLLAFVLYAATPASGSLEIQGLKLSTWTAQELRFGFVWFALLATWMGFALRRVRNVLLAAFALAGLFLTGYPLDDPAMLGALATILIVGLGRWYFAYFHPRWWKSVWNRDRVLPSKLESSLPASAVFSEVRRSSLLWLGALILVLAGTLTGLSFAAREHRHDLRLSLYGDDYAYLQGVLQHGDCIAYTTTRHPYLLLGGDFHHRLLYANPVEIPSGKEYEWLKKRNVDILAIGPRPQSPPGTPPVRRPFVRLLKYSRRGGLLERIHGNFSKGFVFYRVRSRDR